MNEISVLLPVKNGEKYIAEAVDSILRQTFDDFELLIFDDDSSDSTIDVLNQYSDSRIKIYQGKDGFIANLNKGIEMAKGQYIARMDADDIMHPIRLEAQFRVMEREKVELCSSWRIIFGEGIEPYVYQSYYGLIPYPLRLLYYFNFVVHPTVMMRKEFLWKHGLRYQHYPYVEDYKLWFEMAKKNAVFYIDHTPLLFYRMSNDQVSTTREKEMNQQALAMREEIALYLQEL
ncbi:glycosyltransferase family 2 protein [Pedobacter sp. AW31-3R]|uniref:glycosyltransferase family 2 protein n=1 Tax=Pedobacter sp. AW31-3R TaxID=3445781 RepID=UPI003FA01802